MLHDIDNSNIVKLDLLKYFSEHAQLEQMMHLQNADSLGTGQPLKDRKKRSNKSFFENLISESNRF